MDTSKQLCEGVWAGDIVETVHGPGTVSSVAEGRCCIELPQHSLRWTRRISDVRVIDRDPAIEKKQAIKSFVPITRDSVFDPFHTGRKPSSGFSSLVCFREHNSG